MSTTATLLRSAVLLLVLFLSTSAVKADAPGKPVEFGYKVVEANTEGAMVKLMWMSNRDGGTPTSFDVYMAEGQTEDESKFTKIGTVEAEPNSVKYDYLTNRLEPGTYTFYVVAVNADGSSTRSIIKVVTIQKQDNKPAITIVSKRSAEASAGKGWEFEVKIEKKGEFKSVAYYLLEAPEGMTINEETGVISWDNPTEGRHVFVIKVIGTLANGETVIVKQEFVLEVGNNKPAIAIVSAKVEDGRAGKPFEFKVKIETRGEFKSISYSLDGAPDGVEINEESGVITWKDPVEGRYVFTIIVTGTLENGETVTTRQEFVLEIGKAEVKPCAEIVGTVKDADGHPATGVVTVWMVRGDNNGTSKWLPFTKAIIQQGTYGVAVTAGTYKLRFESEEYVAEWYQDASELADAASIEITCDHPRNEINFVVERVPEPVYHTVTGRVFDAEEGVGLENALVVFRPMKPALNTMRGKEVRAESDADGKYEAKLVEGVAYIATAIARPPAGTKNLYLQEWWENTNDATLAKSISLTADQDNVDFSMDQRADYDNGLSGKLVERETLIAVTGKVVAYQISAKHNEPSKHWAESVTTDDQGNYEFTNLAPGKYILQGIPDSRPWVPGWFVDGNDAAESWKKATVLEVGETTTMTELVIKLHKMDKENGRGRIGGHCYNSNGGIVAKSNGVVQGAIPVPGALVIATDNTGTVIDYAFADHDGVYSLETMPVGQFTVTADRVMFEPVSNPVELSEQALDVVSEFGLSPLVTDVEVPVDLVGTTVNLFPNPASTSATLSYTANEGTTSVRVLDVTGTILYTAVVNVNGGVTSLTIPTQTMASGMVMVHITNGQHSFALPLQIVR